MNKVAQFERDWKKKLGEQTVNPNGVDWEQLRKDTEALMFRQPAGSVTIVQFAANLGLKMTTARTRMKELVAGGKYKQLPLKGMTGERYYVKA